MIEFYPFAPPQFIPHEFWSVGPWRHEPMTRSWLDSRTTVRCAMIRTELGH